MEVEETERRLVGRSMAGGVWPQEAHSVRIYGLLLMLQPILYGFFCHGILGHGIIARRMVFLFAWSWQSGQ